jgi:Amt family ammonium transporter
MTAGWLSARHSYGGPVLGGNGFIDCAGSAVVHITAGATGLAGAWLVGPRQCVLAYSSSGAASGSSGGSGSSGSSLLLSALGGLFIWLSWYGLAPGNVVLTVSSVLVAARVSV